MAKGEVNLWYAETDRLLNDICKFLHDEISEGYLSQNGRNIANTLIERSKKHLHTLTMTVGLDTTESYVDMQAYKVNQNQEYPEPQEVYSDVSLTYEATSGSSTIEEDQLICPYASLPANEIREGKTGHLYKREKILFFEQQKKVYAAIQHTWFLVYMNENAMKPSQTFDLARYEVRPSYTQPKDTKKRDESFDLFSLTDPKSHQFTAQTGKDMQQWVAAIKQQTEMIVIKRSLPPVPANNTKDDFIRLSTESNNDYEPLKNYVIKETTDSNTYKGSSTKKVKENHPLPLPPRNTVVKEVQQYIPRMPSDESLSSNYDSVGPGFLNPSRESSNSFSEDDSDTHYDNPTEIRQRSNPPYLPNKSSNGKMEDYGQDIDDDDGEIYDYLENPSFPQNKNVKQSIEFRSTEEETRPKVQTKPKPNLKPKLVLSLRHRKRSDV